MDKPARTSKEQFKLYVKECYKWVELLGLKEWELDFDHEELEIGVEATCTWNRNGRRCTFSLNKAPRFALSSAEIKRVALHEVLHLLLADLEAEAASRTTTEYLIDTVIHSIINRLSNCILG